MFFFSKIYIPLKLLDIIFILIFFKDIPLHNAASQRLSSCVTFISRSVGERETIDVGDFIPVFTGVSLECVFPVIGCILLVCFVVIYKTFTSYQLENIQNKHYSNIKLHIIDIFRTTQTPNRNYTTIQI